MRLLILGGTTEASALAALLAGHGAFEPILSLAGRTRAPATPPIRQAIGGFGGVDGLVAYLRQEAIAAVIDATHPFADRMSAHAEQACRETSVPLAVFTRPPWICQPGDRWTEVPDAARAAEAIGPEPRRVFLTVGRLQLPAFERAPQHDYLIRTIDRPDPPPALRHRLILARGPFSVADEIRLLTDHRIEVLVTKNSGGSATHAKITAARDLNLPVILLTRPADGSAPILHDLASVMAQLESWRHGAAP